MTRLLVVLQVSIHSIAAHKMRSLLTMLGVVIGVAAVIALVAVGQGAQAEVLSRFQSLGSNLLTVSARTTSSFSRTGFRQATRALNETDVEAIRSMASAVAKVAPEYAGNATIVYGAETMNVNVTGVTEDYGAVRNWTIQLGRFISADDTANASMVVVLGQGVLSELFGATPVNPVGQTVRINRQNYEVIGVLKSKGESGASNQDNVAFVPLRTAQLKLGGAGTSTVRTISLQARSSEEMELAEAQVTAILRALHGIQEGGTNDFQIQNQEDLVESVTETTGTFTALLGSIAAISLIVGGIGIMNIMLVSVTERTREIGIRKAVGAKRSDILTQFLVEAIVLSSVGGLLGVIAGIAAAQFVAPLLGSAKAVVTSQSIILALSVSLGIGIFFGAYPANRASQLNPIDALRYE